MRFARSEIPAAALLFALLLGLLGGCQHRQEPPRTEVGGGESPWPGFDYPAAASDGEAVYRLDPDRSRIDVRVGRAGPLARFGHEHVVEVGSPEGWLLLAKPLGRSHANLRFAVDSLEIDDPEARRRYGLDTEVSEKDIDGTRRNLLETVLDPARWPYVSASFSEFTRAKQTTTARTVIDVEGHRFEARFPFEWKESAGGLSLRGSLTLEHTDLGLEPFSTLGGGLRVADALEVHFELFARSLP